MFDFATNRTVASIETVPEQFRPLYKETDDGKFTLSSEPMVVAAVEAIIGQSSALAASRAEAKAHKAKMVDLAPLSEYGTDPAAINTAFSTKVEELTAEIAKGKGASLDLEKMKEAIGESHAKAIAAKDSVIEGMQAQIHKELVTNRATAAIVAAKGNLLLLTPHLNKAIKTVPNEQNEYEAHVVDDDGARRFSGHTGDHMTIEELVSEMKTKPEFGVCFESEAPQGGGTRPLGAPAVNLPADKMNSQQKISKGLETRRAGGNR